MSSLPYTRRLSDKRNWREISGHPRFWQSFRSNKQYGGLISHHFRIAQSRELRAR